MRISAAAVVTLVLAAVAFAQPIGVVDTIGGTYYDWQNGWSVWRTLCNATGHGVYAVWLYSGSDQTTFPDRGMRMNYYDYAMQRWVAIDTANHMNSGYPVFTDRNGFGSLDVDATGRPYVSAHMGTPLRPGLARELGHGSGLFEYSLGPEFHLWPAVAVTANGWMHLAVIDDASREELYYARSRTWGVWDPELRIPSPQPDPMGPRHNIAASKVSDRVCVTWVHSEGSPDPGYYRESTDGGTTWSNPVELPWPDAYGGDTLTSYHITSLFPYYDRQDRLHIVTDVMYYIGNSGFIMPAQIWHWCRDNTPQWHRVRWAGCDPEHLQAGVGYNATYACRASIGQDRFGGLHVAWEEFDSSNVEPGPPEVLRADIFWSQSTDNGYTWSDAEKLTERGTVSHRFPCVMDWMESAGGDHLRIIYMVDQVAGFFVQGEGDPTPNPVVVQSIELSGVEEGPAGTAESSFRLKPNPSGGRVEIEFGIERSQDVRLDVLDSGGRLVVRLEQGRLAAGQHRVEWDAGGHARGVYVVRLRTGDRAQMRKLVMTGR